MISCRDWWPWTEPGYITMTRRQSNNPMEWPHSDSPRPEKLQGKNPLENFSPGFFGIKTASSSLIIFQRSKLSTRSITHLCWCNWRTFWKKNAVGSSPSESCSCTAHRALATQKKLAYLGCKCPDHPPSSPDLASSDYHLFPGLKNNWKVAILVRCGDHCCRGDLVGWTTFWFFFFEWLAKIRTTS